MLAPSAAGAVPAISAFRKLDIAKLAPSHVGVRTVTRAPGSGGPPALGAATIPLPPGDGPRMLRAPQRTGELGSERRDQDVWTGAGSGLRWRDARRKPTNMT